MRGGLTTVNERTRTDDELKAIIETYNESERFGLNFALLPAAKTPEDMTGKDVARMMRLSSEMPKDG